MIKKKVVTDEVQEKLIGDISVTTNKTNVSENSGISIVKDDEAYNYSCTVNC